MWKKGKVAGLARRKTIELICLRPWTSPGSCCGGLWWAGCLPWATVKGGAPPARSPRTSTLPGASCCALQALVGALVLGSSCRFHQGERLDRGARSWAPRTEQGSLAAQGLVVSYLLSIRHSFVFWIYNIGKDNVWQSWILETCKGSRQ